jgi:hypothetical protein
MAAKEITSRDHIVWQILSDPNWRVTPEGHVLTCTPLRNAKGTAAWRRAGRISISRNGLKRYWRVKYRGVEVYANRIVFAATYGYLSPFETIDHKDLNSLNDHPANLQSIPPGQNVSDARQAYKRMGMTAAEAKRNWINGKANGYGWKGAI